VENTADADDQVTLKLFSDGGLTIRFIPCPKTDY
jgi:hypothetical protein